MNDKIQKLNRLAISRHGQKRLDMRFTKDMRARLNHELEIIEKTQTEDDFLSFIQQGDKAKSKGDYYVKGIANCSFLLYCTNTTTVNPLAFGLPFERLRINDPYFEIVFAPKRILTEEEKNIEIENLLVKFAMATEQFSADVLDQKYGYPINGYPFVEKILKPTGGILIWQEQLMELFYRVGGFSYAEADVIRRDIAKKHMKKIYGEVRRRFLEFAMHVGYDYGWVDGFFRYIVERSPYLPTKAHYAVLAFYAD